MAVIGHELFYSSKVVLFGQKWMYSGKSGCIRAKVVVFRQKLLNSGKVVVFRTTDCVLAKVVVFG